MRLFGLIGYPLSHSFSKGFFTEKFQREGITGCSYENFPIPSITGFPALFDEHPALEGLNVTIPYKRDVIRYLDELSSAAEAIGAVNCVRKRDGRLMGFNTDVIGFRRSLEPLLQAQHTHALVLGAGGAAKAVVYALKELGIAVKVVSRQDAHDTIHYEALDKVMVDTHRLIVNTTPLGMYPNMSEAPPVPYEYIGPEHLLYDLVYNPAETLFMQEGLKRGAAVKNGLEMLILQAEASWDIWNDA